MPVLTGILVSTAPKSFSAVANSVANMFYNIFGYIPAPFVYGAVTDLTGGKTSRYGIAILMFWTITGNIWLLIAAYSKSSNKPVNKHQKDDRKFPC